MQTKEQMRREYKNEWARKAYAKDPVKGRLKRRKFEAAHPGSGYRTVRRWKLSNVKCDMFNSKKAQAKRHGIEFTLVLADTLWPEFCPVLGIKLVYERDRGGGRRPYDDSPSFDRINSTLGYIPGNVLIVSNRANAIKRNASPEELRKVAKFYTDLATVAPLERQKRASSNVVPGAVLAGLLAEQPGFVEDVQSPDDDFGGISRDTIEFSHD